MEEGWGGRVGKGMGRKGREGRGNKHTRFKTCGAAHGQQPMMRLAHNVST